jgi:methylthioribose-1-phosphate isomerase
MPVQTILWTPDTTHSPVPGSIVMIDQTRLPQELHYLHTRDVNEVWTAIKTLQVRGAPAIGIAAAMGVVVAVQDLPAWSSAEIVKAVNAAADRLATSRPTAVNLFWALDRMRAVAGVSLALSPTGLKERLANEALAIFEEDRVMCRTIGRHGATLLKDGATILTHCNAGGLATSGYGTALAPVYVATEEGRRIRVFADETRPLLQGARLTAWELMQAGIDVTLICDNMAAHTMKTQRIDAILVGADRIAANGDTANKIGTYGVAVLAKAHGIPFYVLAPSSTFDLALASGDEIPIEERGPEEITRGFGKPTAPDGVKTYSPAFDVTPADLITAIVCERGVLYPPFNVSLCRSTRGAGR